MTVSIARAVTIAMTVSMASIGHDSYDGFDKQDGHDGHDDHGSIKRLGLAHIDSGSQFNAIHPAYTAKLGFPSRQPMPKLGFPVRRTKVGALKIDRSPWETRFFAQGQAGKVQTYGLQRESSSGRRTRLPTTKWAEPAKEFAAAALRDDDKSLCDSVSKAKNVHPFRQAQIASLDVKEVPVTIPAEYSDYTNVFSL